MVPKPSKGLASRYKRGNFDEADKHATDMALIVAGEIRYSGTIIDFKRMVNPNGALSLDDSYLQYIKTASNQEITNN